LIGFQIGFQIGLARLARITLAGLSFSIQWTTKEMTLAENGCDFKNGIRAVERQKNTTTIIYFLGLGYRKATTIPAIVTLVDCIASRQSTTICHWETLLQCFNNHHHHHVVLGYYKTSSCA
jgi:hypothetical protein